MEIKKIIIGAGKNLYKFLKPNGYARVAVPDINFDNEWYRNMCKPGGPGNIDNPAYSHKVFYDYKTLIKVFENAGFIVDLLEYCDFNFNLILKHIQNQKKRNLKTDFFFSSIYLTVC